MRHGALVLLALLVLTHATGLITIGLVTTGSMTPTLTEGSLFLALRSTPTEDAIVVFESANGDQAVHRVVEMTPRGLITQGDANERTDQAAGEPPVDPRAVNVVPTVGEAPLALSADWMKPLAIFAAQGLALTYAIHRLLRQSNASSASWPLNQVRASHLVFAAGLLLLAMSPLLAETLDANGQIEVQGLVVPTIAHVSTDEAETAHLVGPLGAASMPADGPTEVVRAPALPGASILAQHGAVWAMLPSTLVAAFIGAVLRLEGR